MKKIVKKSVLLLVFCLLLCSCGAVKEAEVSETATAETTESANEEAEAVTEESSSQDAGEVKTESAVEAEEETESVTESEIETAPEKEEETEVETETQTEALKEIVVTPFEAAKTMYATIALNVRKGPSTDYEVVGHLAQAQAAEVTGQADTGWYQITLNGENAFVSHKYMSETKVEAPAPQPAVPTNEQPATNVQSPAPTATVAPAGVIMVGDSRCVQMQAAVGGGGCSWICENSKEYTWFVNTAIPKFDEYVGNGTKVVINMGVNDPEHYKDYVATINAKAAEWAQRGAKTYLVSVNPVWENPYTSQEQVDTFNANVPGMLAGVTWIDTSSWLTTNGYRVLDGLHYDDPTYVNIFNLIMGSL